jgi:CDP-paratose synthetase
LIVRSKMITGNICITGATGFIGGNLVKSLQVLGGSSITAVARSTDACEKIKNLDVECYLDDGDTEHLVRFFREQKFDTVVHLASLYLKDHQSHQIENLISSNISFGTRLLEASVKSSVKSFINTGTFWQHFDNKIYSPVNLYAASKQAFEMIARYYQESSNILFTTLYLNDTYGPGDTRKKILNIWKAMTDTDSMDMSPGEQKINLLHIRDVVRGYLRLIHLVQSGNLTSSAVSYVLKSDEEMTLRQLAALFERIAQKKLNINWGALPYKDREVMTVWDGGTTVAGWEPLVSLKEGLKEFILQN